MKRKVTILVTTTFILLTLSALITPLRAQTATPNVVQERSSSNRDSLHYQIDEILSSGKLVFLYFYKENCYACRLQKPMIEELEQEYSSDVVFIRVNGLENRKAMAEFGVIGFPTMFLIFGKNVKGYEYKDFMGYTEKSLLKNSIDSLISPVAESVDTLESADLSHEMASETESEDIVPTGTVYYCKDCADCNSKIAAASPGDTVILTADIIDHRGSCINIANTGVIFDGGGHIIDGDGVGTDEYGVGVIGRPKNTITNCKITDFYYGIYLLDRADNTLITKNEVGTEKVSNTYGIYIYGCNEVVVKENFVGYNQVSGIHVRGDGWNSIIENEVIKNKVGIYLETSMHNTIEKNVVEGNGQGVFLDSSNDNTVNNNIANSNDVGIYLRLSNRTTLTGNTANYNNYGIWLTSSNDNQVINNIANYNNAKPDSFGIRLDYDSNSNNITLNTMSYNGDGLHVYRSCYNYIMNNTALHNDYYGVWLRECYYNLVWWNTFSFNRHGIYLVYTTYYIWIDGNKVENNQEYGIRLEHCNWTYIWYNKVNSNKHGIYLWGDSDLNSILYNQIVHNDQYGVYFESTSNNCSLSGNVICQNLVDIKDLDANSGDENTCNTPDGWDDDGTTGCTYSCPTGWCYDYTISEWINPPTTGDWNVDHVIECNDTEITLNGNLRISGELRFNHVLLMMNVTSMEVLANIYTIEVKSGGAFYINSKGGFPSVITNGLNASAYYTFQVKSGSMFEMRNSELHNCGFAWNKPNLNLAGLWIATDGVIIESNVINFNYVGMIFYNSSNHRIYNNVINSNDWFGIYGLNSHNNEIEYNEIIDNGKHPLALAGGGISLTNASNSVITHNTVTSNRWDGISLSNAPHSTITDNIVNSNSDDGIVLSSSPESSIAYNTANSNGDEGIILSGSPLSDIIGNTANSNGEDGIYVSSSEGTEIINNTADSNGDDGIALSDSPGSTIADNTPDWNGDCGVHVSSSPGTQITGNIVNHNNHGIYVSSSANTGIADNDASFNDKTTRHSTGIYVTSSPGSIINNNTANSNWRGIFLEKSSGSTISNNVVSSNTLFGIHLYLSHGNMLSDNNVDFSTGEWDSAGIYLSNSEENTIVNNEVNLNWFGMVLWESPYAHIELNNVNFNDKTGISLELSDYSFINYNNATFNRDGISIVTSDHVIIMNNTATSNSVGISLSSSDWANIFYNNASDNSGTGISLSGSHHNTIHENFAERNKYGISLSSSSFNGIFNNTATLNNFGISLRWSSNSNEVIDNDAKLCIDYGAYLFRSDGNFIIHNDFSNSGSVGIYLEQSHDNHITDNNATSAQNYGINLFESNRNLIHSNDVRFSIDIGIELSSSHYNNLTQNTAEGSDVGISIRFSSNNRVMNNHVVGNDIGIYLLRSSNNIILENDASMNNNVGIDLSLSDFNEIVGNLVNENPNYGIHLYSCELNIVEGNIANLNGVGIYLDWSVNNVVRENTVTHNGFAGIAVYWSSDHNQILFNQVHSNMNISIRISSSRFNHVEGNNVSLSGVGIFLDWSENNVIVNNTAASSAYHGFTLEWFSNNNQIINNYATGGLIGISLDMSSNNTISHNNASLNDIGMSIEWLSNDNTIIYNTMCYNEYHGLSFHWESNDNLVRNNVIGYNNEYGVFVYESSNNTIYHNEIIYNTIQAFANALNAWDNGYPSGGNYWSDYIGDDHFSGPYQNKTGEDGIGDTPYIINASNIDRYPLMKPYTPQRILVYTDKYSYHAGNKMHLGLHVMNLEDALQACVEIWVELPGGSTHVILHAHDITLPAGLDYNNPSFRSFTLPAITPGIYTWHAALLNPATHEIIVEDTAQWEFT